jgi:hypothetical protein
VLRLLVTALAGLSMGGCLFSGAVDLQNGPSPDARTGDVATPHPDAPGADRTIVDLPVGADRPSGVDLAADLPSADGGDMPVDVPAPVDTPVGQDAPIDAPVDAPAPDLAPDIGPDTPEIDPSLIFWYRFDDAITAATAIDSSGNGHDATLHNPAVIATGGEQGNALSLPSGNGYAEVPAGLFTGVSDFTFAAWVNPSQLADWMRVFDFGTGTSKNMYVAIKAAGANLRYAATTNGVPGEKRLNGPAVATGTWTHVAVVQRGTTGTLYVNGAQVDQQTITVLPSDLGSTTNNYLGRSEYGSDPYYRGLIDDARMYSRALSSTEVAALATP